MMKNSSQQRARFRATLISLLIFGLVLVFALQYKDSIILTIQHADMYWVALGALSYALNYLVRAYRLWMLTGKYASYIPGYLKIAGLHGFYSYFFPLRSGDLTLPFLLKYHVGFDLAEGGRVLIRARMLDVYSIGFFLVGATLLTPSLLSIHEKYIFLAVGISFVSLPYATIYLLRKCGGFKITDWFKKIAGDVQPQYPKVEETLVSLFLWFWTGCTLFCVIRSLQIPLSFFDVWFVTTVQLPLQLLPIHGFANAGSHEASWIVALGMLGVAVKDGLTMALSSHVLIIVYVTLLGGASVLLPAGRVAGLDINHQQ